MKENTIKALKLYKTFLEKHKLEENKEYKANFELKTLIGKQAIQSVKPSIIIDIAELSPMVMFDCFGKDGYVGAFGFMEPSVILDKYDKDAIISEMTENISSLDYDIKLGKQILDKISLEL